MNCGRGIAAALLAVTSSACVGMSPGVKVHAFVEADTDAPIVESAPGPAFVERPLTEGLGDLGLGLTMLDDDDAAPTPDLSSWSDVDGAPRPTLVDPELPTSLHARPGYEVGEGWQLGLWTGTDFMENGLGGFVAGVDVFDNWAVTDSMLTLSCAYGLGEATSLCGTAAAMRIQDMGLASSISDADLAWLVVGLQFQF